MKEIAGKMIICNIHRFLQFLVTDVFYRIEFSNNQGISLTYKNGYRINGIVRRTSSHCHAGGFHPAR